MEYEITVCPVCGYQDTPDEMFGRLDCPTHGETEPLVVKVEPTGPTTVPCWRIKNGIVAYWALVDPRTRAWGYGRTPAVLDAANQ